MHDMKRSKKLSLASICTPEIVLECITKVPNAFLTRFQLYDVLSKPIWPVDRPIAKLESIL